MHNFCLPTQGGDYFGSHGQFRSASVDSYQQLDHPQDGMYGSASMQHFSMLPPQVPTAPFERPRVYRC